MVAFFRKAFCWDRRAIGVEGPVVLVVVVLVVLVL
jgi:hypothetical protein